MPHMRKEAIRRQYELDWVDPATAEAYQRDHTQNDIVLNPIKLRKCLVGLDIANCETSSLPSYILPSV